MVSKEYFVVTVLIMIGARTRAFQIGQRSRFMSLWSAASSKRTARRRIVMASLFQATTNGNADVTTGEYKAEWEQKRKELLAATKLSLAPVCCFVRFAAASLKILCHSLFACR